MGQETLDSDGFIEMNMAGKSPKEIIREYMSQLGRKGGLVQGNRNKLKGSAYFSKISSVKKPRKKIK